MARRERARVATVWLAIALSVEILVTRVLDFSGAETVWATAGLSMLDLEHDAWIRPWVLQWYMESMLAYAFIMTLVLSCFVAWLWQAKGKRTQSAIGAMQKLHGMTLFCLAIFLLVTLRNGHFIVTYAVDVIAQFVMMIGLLFPSRATTYDAKEARLLDWEVQQIDGCLDDAPDAVAIDDIERDLNVLQKSAEFAGYSLSKISNTRDQLDAAKAAVRIRQALEHGKAMSMEQLRSLSGLPAEKFALLLFDLCKRFNLSIAGDKVMFLRDVDMSTFVRDVDTFFAQWRETEAAKLGKVL
nr:hypothetical protein [Candidatus Sigynarchaeum springense]